MMMSREKIRFPTIDAYHRGIAFLVDAVPVYVYNEKRRTMAAGEIPQRLRAGLADLGAIVSEDGRHDAEVKRVQQLTAAHLPLKS
jgi:hypothetical protein